MDEITITWDMVWGAIHLAGRGGGGFKYTNLSGRWQNDNLLQRSVEASAELFGLIHNDRAGDC